MRCGRWVARQPPTWNQPRNDALAKADEREPGMISKVFVNLPVRDAGGRRLIRRKITASCSPAAMKSWMAHLRGGLDYGRTCRRVRHRAHH